MPGVIFTELHCFIYPELLVYTLHRVSCEYAIPWSWCISSCSTLWLMVEEVKVVRLESPLMGKVPLDAWELFTACSSPICFQCCLFQLWQPSFLDTCVFSRISCQFAVPCAVLCSLSHKFYSLSSCLCFPTLPTCSLTSVDTLFTHLPEIFTCRVCLCYEH